MGYREEYQSWLTRFAADPDTVAELQSIAKDEKEIEDRFYTELAFGTGGLRGVQDVPQLYTALRERGYGEGLLEDIFWNNLRRIL